MKNNIGTPDQRKVTYEVIKALRNLNYDFLILRKKNRNILYVGMLSISITERISELIKEYDLVTYLIGSDRSDGTIGIVICECYYNKLPQI